MNGPGGRIAVLLAIVRLDCAELPSYEAEIVTFSLELTLPVKRLNVAEVSPAGTMTVAGTDAMFIELEESDTSAPPEGAGEDSVTSPLTVVSLDTELDGRNRRRITMGSTVRLTCDETPPYEAAIVTLSLEVTLPAVTMNEAEVVPAGTITSAGTVAAPEAEESDTTAPPEGAAAERVTPPLTAAPLARESEGKIKP
jgi:hypothetical protein